MSRAGIVGEHHYDEGNDFYATWLDPDMQYSCAHWKDLPLARTPEALGAAQRQKLRLVAEKLQLEPGMTVLEIGCGWGGLAVYLAQEHGVRVVGITISQQQLRSARQRAEDAGVDDRVSFEYQDYRSMEGAFDRVVSIAMLEAVGYKNLDAYMGVVERCLKPAGLALVHTIASNRSTKTAHQRWITRYIFPNGFLPSLAQVCQNAERKMVVEDVQNFGPDYDATLLCWKSAFEKAWQEGRIDRPGVFYRMWSFYLAYCAAGFRARTVQLYQVVLSKGRAARYDAPRA